MSNWAKNVACVNRSKQFLIMRNWAENIFGLVYAKKIFFGMFLVFIFNFFFHFPHFMVSFVRKKLWCCLFM